MKMKIQIQFRNGKEPLTYEAKSTIKAVRMAIEEKADLGGVFLSGVNFSHADLRGADLLEADLSDTDLSFANFSHASLRRVNLVDANLTNTNLYRASLMDADLTGANLNGANLRHADLRYAKVQGRQLWTRRPYLAFGACGPENHTTLVFLFEDSSEPFITYGCFRGSLTEFKVQIKEYYAGSFCEEEYNAMVDYITALHKIQRGGNE